VKIQKLAWLGTRTEQDSGTAAFFSRVLGLPEAYHEDGFWVFTLPDGAKVEVFGPACPYNRHFDTGPVAGFLVEDVPAAAEELRAAGVEIVSGPTSAPDGNAWVHFRGPDGRLYEFTQDPGVARAERPQPPADR
jgi:catechol 2,3-dioxygenase-like lactoylglutathione lyase family enzyme